MSVLCWCILIGLFRFNLGKYEKKKSYSFQHRQQVFTKKIIPVDANGDGVPWFCLFVGVCNSTWNYGYPSNENSGVEMIHQWSQLEFDFHSESARQAAISSGEFIIGHPTPVDVDVIHYGNNRKKMFVTIPRFQDGVPATLGVITERKYNGNPIIAPFPSWSWHQQPNKCSTDRIVSVYRVKIDECGRLWVLDNGRLVDKQICPPQILAFDTVTHELIHRYELPEDQYESVSIFVTITVDVRDHQCRDTFVYAADCQVPSLIVYDVKKEKSWKIVDKTMYPYPNYGTFNILGTKFDLMDGILGMDLSPYVPGEDRVLFFHAMSSGTENWVYTSYIRNHTLFKDDPSPKPEIFQTYPDLRHSQVPAMAIDKKGIAYFGLASDTAINCWNTNTLYGDRNIGVLLQNTQTLQFPSGVKVINNGYNQELWFLTMRFQKVYQGTLNLKEINFRIQAAKVDFLLQGSKCLNNHNYNNGVGEGIGSFKPVIPSGGFAFGKNDSSNHYENGFYPF